MATANPFDEIFNTEVDESKFNAVLGSLESQLASPSIRDQSQTNTHSSVMTNHVSGIKYSGGHSNSPNEQTRVDSKLFDNRSVPRTNVHNVNGNKNMIGSVNFSNISSMVSPGTGPCMTKIGNVAINSISNSPRVVPTNLSSVKSEVGVIQKNIVSGQLHINSSASPTTNNSPGPQIHGGTTVSKFSTGASDQKPVLMHSGDIKPNLRIPADTKSQVVVNVLNTGSVQRPQVFIKQETKPNIKQEIKPEYSVVSQHVTMSSHSQSPVNVISAVKTTSFANTSSNVLTFQRQVVSNPQTVTVVRPSSHFTTVPNTGLQNVVQQVSTPASHARMVSPHISRTIAPRMTNAPLKIAPQQPPQVQMMPVRQPSSSNTITLPPGLTLPQGTMLVKNAEGQLVMVSNQNPASQPPNQKISVNRHGMPVSTAPALGPNPALRHPNMVPGPPNRPSVPVVVSGTHGPTQIVQPPIGQPPAATPGGVQHTKETVFESMKKCKNFLQTLIKLATNQPKDTVENVKRLIQQLIDGKIEPENFTAQLQVELNSSPQPYLVPFLKKSLPMLRWFLIQNKCRIEGVRPPPEEVMRKHPIPNLPPGALGVPGPPPSTSIPTPQLTPKHSGPGGVPQYSPHQVQHLMRMQTIQTKSTPATQTMALLTRPSAPTSGKTVSRSLQQTLSSSSTQSSKSPGLASTPTTHKAEKRKFDSSLKDGDDDINDVATMGGVNLSEESRNILATSSEIVSGQMRSCKDENFLANQPLLNRINKIAHRHGLEDCPQEVANVISHATQERLRNLLERLAITAEHRLEIYRTDKKYEVKSDPRSQLKFLEELDQIEKKRQDEVEREVLLRAAKKNKTSLDKKHCYNCSNAMSRSKNEDPEQLKLKEKAKAMQQAELEEMRQREANLTALAAIGPRKKRKLEDFAGSSGTPGSVAASGSKSNVGFRPRIKRVNLRDLMFLLEQEKETNKSHLLFKAFMK